MEKNKINLYICHTYYHVLISIIKQLKSGIDSDIILTASNSIEFLINDNALIRRLQKFNVFKKVIVFKYFEKEGFFKNWPTAINRIRLGNKIIRKTEYKFYKYNKIYIFNDNSLIGYILNKLNLKYNVLEDGTDCFKSRYGNFVEIEEPLIKKSIKKFLKIYNRAESPIVESIEVNDKEDIGIKHSNIIESPKKNMFLSLSKEEKEIIIQIFLKDFNNILLTSNSIIILTQPFSEDGICSTEAEKINLYKNIIDKHKDSESIIIKTHPREITDYNKYFKEYKNIKVMEERFPIEILNFLNIRFKKVITISSTAINLIENVDEKIEVGYR